jgi:uncharacterized protein (UPF0332 family)
MTPEVLRHLDRAGELLQVAREILDANHPADSISRSYYAMFHGAVAVLLALGIERSSHHGVWAAFGEFVAHPGLMDVSYHHAGLDAFRARVRSDYLASPGDTVSDAEESLADAREFVAACRRFLETR